MILGVLVWILPDVELCTRCLDEISSNQSNCVAQDGCVVSQIVRHPRLIYTAASELLAEKPVFLGSTLVCKSAALHRKPNNKKGLSSVAIGVHRRSNGIESQ